MENDRALCEFRNRLRHPVVLYVDVYPVLEVEANQVRRVLLLRRRVDVRLSGDWQFVSGKVRAGESIADAFRRQLEAKTGQRATRMWKAPFITTFYDEHYDAVMLVPGAVAELGSLEVVLDESLHIEHRWCGLEEARSLVRWEQQKSAIDRVAELLSDPAALTEAQMLR